MCSNGVCVACTKQVGYVYSPQLEEREHGKALPRGRESKERHSTVAELHQTGEAWRARQEVEGVKQHASTVKCKKKKLRT